MELEQFKARFRTLAELRQERDLANAAKDRAEAEYRAYEAELFAELEEAGIKGAHKFDFGGDLGVMKFQTRKTKFGRIIDENAALDAFEQAAIIDEMTHAKIKGARLHEYVRDVLESGNELPDGIDYYEKKAISISKVPS